MSFSFTISEIGHLHVEKLSEFFCKAYCNEILKLINLIPYINWTIKELLSQSEDYYNNKWNYSYVVKNEKEEIVGVLIAYFRKADCRHIFDSLYLHRFVIDPEYQNKGVGTQVLKYFIARSFAEIPWLLNISVQTNNEPRNQYVLNFYRHMGFKDMYDIVYPNKLDTVLLFERKLHQNSIDYSIKKSDINLIHPRLNVTIDLDSFSSRNVLPVFFFSTTNEKKKQMVKFILNNYNIDVSYVTFPIELTEPQIESPELEEERKLVSIPLKSVSRFVTNTAPYTIEDTMLFVEYFNRHGQQWELPGLDTKRWLRQMGLDGFLEIMGNTIKRKAKFVSQTGAYIKSEGYFFGRGEILGTIAKKKAEIITPKYGTYPYFFHLVFIPDGANKTLAEMDMYEYAQYDYMRKSICQLIQKLSEFGTFQRQYTLFDYIRYHPNTEE